jgi:hypothetical protein
LFILLLACQPEEEQFLETDPDQQEVENFIADAEELFLDPSARSTPELDPCGDPVDVPLMAWRSRIGTVSISNTVDHLLVEYATYSGFVLHKTMLVVMIEKKNRSSAKWKYAKYKKLILPVHHKGEIENYTYEIPYSKLKLAGDECITIIAISLVKETNNPKNHRTIYALGKLDGNYSKSIFKRYFIDYCLQKCKDESDPDDGSCVVDCTYAFGIPSVDVLKSFTFEELGISDWPWGYAHEIKQETLFRLPLKSVDSENEPVVGQVTVMIEGNYLYVYYNINDGYSLSKTKVYLSPEQPVSGIPCNYTYERDYRNADGTLTTKLTDTYEIADLDQIRATDGKFWIIAYADFCE